MRKSRFILSLIVLLLCVATSAEEKKSTSSDTKAAKETEASQEKASTQSESQNESPLVKAAREAKAKRGEDKARVTITNKDVERSTGKLIQSTDKPLEPLPKSTPTAEEMRAVAASNATKATRAELQTKIDSYQKTVTDLERELRRIEETYYNEDDPDYREDVLATNFEDTRKQLEAARKELAEARKALAATGRN